MRLFLIPALALTLSACASDADTTADGSTPDTVVIVEADRVAVGEPVGADLMFVSADDLATRADEMDGQQIAVEGTVREVCQQKGCWMTLDNAAGETIRVAVPQDADGEYLYTFPMDTAGRGARLSGTVAVEETDVETLRHLAQDGGESAQAIAAITAPERTIVLTATGASFAPAAAHGDLPPGHPPLPQGHPPIEPGHEGMKVGPLKPEAERTLDA